MSFFDDLVKSKLEKEMINRYNSVDSFINYLSLVGNMGRIDEIVFSFSILDKLYIDNNRSELDKRKVFGNLERLVEKINTKNTYDIKDFILDRGHSKVEVYKKVSNYLATLKEKGEVSHENNLILNFLVNIALAHNAIDTELSIALVNHFSSAKKCNNYRKDYCIFSIVDSCIRNNDTKFFKLQKQYYNHIQKIYSRISKSSILTTDEKKLYQTSFSMQLKRVNNLKSKSNYRIAVCISGIYRNHIDAIESIKNNIVDPLNADVFIHTWDQKAIWSGVGGAPMSKRLFGSIAEPLIPKELERIKQIKKYLPKVFDAIENPINEDWDGTEIIEILRPKNILIESEEAFEKSLKNKEGYLLARGNFNQIKMFHGIKISFDLALDAGDYDYILRIRPDLSIKDKLSIVDFSDLENNTIYAGASDVVGLQETEFALSSSMAHNLSSFIAKMFEFNALSPYEEFPLYCSHALIFSWLLEFNYTHENSLLNRELLSMGNRKIYIEGLAKSITDDFEQLSDSNKSKFLPFLEYLRTNFC